MISFLALALLVGAVFAFALALAATAMHLNAQNARKARRRNALEKVWRPLLLDAFANGDPAPLIASVEPADTLFFIEFAFRYVVRLDGRERGILREATASFLPALARRLRNGADVEQRARTVRTIGILGGSEYDADLLRALEDPSPLVSMTAARALALRAHPQLVSLFLARADRFRDWSPRFFASMLASAGQSACSSLREIARDEGRNDWTRRVAVEALAELNDLESAIVATEVLDRSDDRDLQCAALRLLDQIGSPAHAGAVRQMFDAPDPMVRLCAISAIGRLGDEEDLPKLRSVLNSPEMWIALNAARALRKLGDAAFLASVARQKDARAQLAAQVLREQAV